jgi:hypothetical protein
VNAKTEPNADGIAIYIEKALNAQKNSGFSLIY